MRFSARLFGTLEYIIFSKKSDTLVIIGFGNVGKIEVKSPIVFHLELE